MVHIKNEDNLEKTILELGFLPFFRNDIPSFSIEDLTSSELWFEDVDGPWEWKGAILRNGNCAYGKFFNKKAGFISLKYFSELANYRRSIYKLNSPSPLAEKANIVYQTIQDHESLLSSEIKNLCGYKKDRQEYLNPIEKQLSKLDKRKSKEKISFESIMTYLQMGTWIVVADFEYKYNKKNQPYGWGIARFCTPEALYDTSYSISRSSIDSKKWLVDYLSQLLPQATSPQITKIVG